MSQLSPLISVLRDTVGYRKGGTFYRKLIWRIARFSQNLETEYLLVHMKYSHEIFQNQKIIFVDNDF